MNIYINVGVFLSPSPLSLFPSLSPPFFFFLAGGGVIFFFFFFFIRRFRSSWKRFRSSRRSRTIPRGRRCATFFFFFSGFVHILFRNNIMFIYFVCVLRFFFFFVPFCQSAFFVCLFVFVRVCIHLLFGSAYTFCSGLHTLRLRASLALLLLLLLLDLLLQKTFYLFRAPNLSHCCCL